jgi:PAS domain S-box-containing protein
VALGIAVGNTLEAVIGAGLLRRLPGFSRSLSRATDVVALATLAGLVSTAVSATIGVSTSFMGGVVARDAIAVAWKSWWVGDMLGILVVAPPLLLWQTVRSRRWPPARRVEVALIATIVLSASLFVFALDLVQGISVAYFVFPALLLASLRFGQPGAVYSTLLMAVVAVAGTATNHGPFAVGPLGQRLLVLQTFTAVVAVTMLILGAVIEERTRAMRGLRDERDFASTVLDIAGLIVVLDDALRIVAINRACQQATGLETEAAGGRRFAELFALPDEIEAVEEGLTKAVASGRRSEWESRFHGAAGDLRHVRWSSVAISPPFQDVAVVCSGIDLTDRRRLTAELAAERNALKDLNDRLEETVVRRTDQVRALAGALALAEQRERTRISHVLHDDLQQVIYGQLLRLRMVRDRLTAGDLEGASGEIGEVDTLLRQAIDLTRTLVADLNPPVLSEDGLAEGVAWLADRMRTEHGLAVDVAIGDGVRLRSRDAQSLLLQMLRELLFNVVKHAETDAANVSIIREGDTIRVTVADAGAGFEPRGNMQTEHGQQGFGLASIQDRLALVGGRMKVEAKPSAGTRVVLEVPVDLAGVT